MSGTVTPYRRGMGPKRDRKQDTNLLVLGVALLACAFLGVMMIIRGDVQSENSLSTPTPSTNIAEMPDAIEPTAMPITGDVDPSGMTLATRFIPPEGYERVTVNAMSFSQFLRDLPLKEYDAPVLLYNGEEKQNPVHLAVVDMPIGNRDLLQSADCILLLRAEWMWDANRQEEIAFHFANGFKCEYSRWRRGYRMRVEDNRVTWEKTAAMNSGHAEFLRYMEAVYTYANTTSLREETSDVLWRAMEIGDILLDSESMGHVMLVADMAVDIQTGKKVYLLLQGGMPAQEMQIVKNAQGGAWYELGEDLGVTTPECSYTAGSLRRY